MGYVSRGQQDRPVCPIPSSSQVSDLCHHPPAELVTPSLSPDLPPGEGLQVKLSISTASPSGL